jgi:hypothetical protein
MFHCASDFKPNEWSLYLIFFRQLLVCSHYLVVLIKLEKLTKYNCLNVELTQYS